MKQRVNIRKTVTIGATILAKGYGPKPCTIRDFSETGMYIACKKSLDHGHVIDPLMIDEHRYLSAGDELDIQVAVPLRAHTENFCLLVEVVRCFEDSIGVRFLGSSEKALDVLQQVVDQQVAEKLAEGMPEMHQHAVNTSAISQCQRLVRSMLDPLLNSCMERFEQYALQHADVTVSNLEKSLFINAVDELRFHRGSIVREIIQNIEIEFSKLGLKIAENYSEAVHQDSIHKSVCYELERVVFDDWLSTTDMIRKAEREYEMSLIDLNHRIGDLLGRDISNENNPIAPSFLCHEFYAQVVTMSLGKQVLTLVFETFYKEVLQNLHKLYDETSTLLIRAGTSSAEKDYVIGAPTLQDRA